MRLRLALGEVLVARAPAPRGAQGGGGRPGRRPQEPLRPRPEGARAARHEAVRQGGRRRRRAPRAGPHRPQGRLPEGDDPRGRGATSRARCRPSSQLLAAAAHGRAGRARPRAHDRVFLVHLGFAYQQLERYREAADAFARAVATGGEPTRTCSASTSTRWCWPRTRRKALDGGPGGTGPLPGGPGARRLRGQRAAQRRRRRRPAWPPSRRLRAALARQGRGARGRGRLLPEGQALRGRGEDRCAQAVAVEPRNLRALFQLGRRPRAPEAAATRRRRCSARRSPSSRTPRPSSTTSAT